MEGIDKIGEASERNAIIFTVKVLQCSVDFKNVGKSAGALYTKFLI